MRTQRELDADLHILVAALYVRINDLLHTFPSAVGGANRVGTAPNLSDSEVMTFGVMVALLGNTSEARWPRPPTPSRVGYSPTCVRPNLVTLY